MLSPGNSCVCVCRDSLPKPLSCWPHCHFASNSVFLQTCASRSQEMWNIRGADRKRSGNQWTPNESDDSGLYLLMQVRTLKGHANWVKNIEYAHNAELLVTSGFDGSIYAWDINRFSADLFLFA